MSEYYTFRKAVAEIVAHSQMGRPFPIALRHNTTGDRLIVLDFDTVAAADKWRDVFGVSDGKPWLGRSLHASDWHGWTVQIWTRVPETPGRAPNAAAPTPDRMGKDVVVWNNPTGVAEPVYDAQDDDDDAGPCECTWCEAARVPGRSPLAVAMAALTPDASELDGGAS